MSSDVHLLEVGVQLSRKNAQVFAIRRRKGIESAATPPRGDATGRGGLAALAKDAVLHVHIVCVGGAFCRTPLLRFDLQPGGFVGALFSRWSHA